MTCECGALVTIIYLMLVGITLKIGQLVWEYYKS